jgi:hypothetical protein
VVSVRIQVFVTMPAMTEYVDTIVKSLPPPRSRPGAPPPFDIRAFMGVMTTASTVVSLLFGTALMAVFPVVAYVWAGRLDRRRADAGAGAERSSAD